MTNFLIEKMVDVYTLFFQFAVLGLIIISLFGLLAIRRDLVTVLIATELMFLNSVLILIPFCYLSNSIESEVFVLFILVVAAAETAVTFAILSNFYLADIFSGEEKNVV